MKIKICSFYIEGENHPFTYLSSSNYSMQEYMSKIHNRIQEIREMNSSYAQVIVEDERIFIVRNVYTTTDYKKFGTLVLELNRKNMFADIALDKGQALAFCINDKDNLIAKSNFFEDERKINILKDSLINYSVSDNNKLIISQNKNYYGYLLQVKHDDYHLGILLAIDKAIVNAEMNHLYGMIFILLIITIPVLIIIAYFLNKQITAPIKKLVQASQEMENGKLGVTIDGEEMPNKEFKYLQHSFNNMSKRVEYLFNYAYDEKLAKKDAKILALQAQISPHFLNNTLEIMNWQARMSGDITLCKMIESLGTVLDYHMDREDKRLIYLSEELRCVDAYFYIISMRFGQRLIVEREIDNELLQAMVPQLILQPILENAVVHGIETVRTGVIKLKIYHDNKKIFIEDNFQASDEEWKAKVATDFASGNEPDVIQFFTDATANSIIATDKLMSLENIKKEYPDYAKDTLDVALEAVTNTDGIQRAVPTTGYWEGPFCNKDLFEEYNVEIPTDWDSLVKAIEIFKENGIIPIACSLNNVPHYWVEFLMLYASGEDSYTSIPEKAPKDWVKGLELFKELREMGAFPEDTDTVDDAYVGQLFNDKKAAMQLDGNWRIGGITDQENVVVVAFPGVENQKATDGAIVGSISSGFYITKKAWEDTDKRELAVKFVEAHTNKEGVTKYWIAGGAVGQAAVAVEPVGNMTPLAVSALEYSSSAKSISSPTDSRIDPEAYKYIIANIVKISTGSVSAEEVLNEALKLNSERAN